MPRLLYVEDNEMNRDMLSRRLQRRGFDVLIAADGEQGVSLAAAERPDLILMDMSLPVLDGWEATRRIPRAGCAERERDDRRANRDLRLHVVSPPGVAAWGDRGARSPGRRRGR